MYLVLFTCWVNKNMQSLCFLCCGRITISDLRKRAFFLRHPVLFMNIANQNYFYDDDDHDNVDDNVTHFQHRRIKII